MSEKTVQDTWLNNMFWTA